MTRKVSECEKHANITGDWKAVTNMAWDQHGPTMDWLGMEATLRAYVKASGNRAVDEIVAAFTKRGLELACSKCNGQFCDCETNEARIAAL